MSKEPPSPTQERAPPAPAHADAEIAPGRETRSEKLEAPKQPVASGLVGGASHESATPDLDSDVRVSFPLVQPRHEVDWGKLIAVEPRNPSAPIILDASHDLSTAPQRTEGPHAACHDAGKSRVPDLPDFGKELALHRIGADMTAAVSTWNLAIPRVLEFEHADKDRRLDDLVVPALAERGGGLDTIVNESQVAIGNPSTMNDVFAGGGDELALGR